MDYSILIGLMQSGERAQAYRTVPNDQADASKRFAWLETATADQKKCFPGGKTKRALYDAGLLEQCDYFKPLTEIQQSGIIILGEKALNHSTVGEYIKPSKQYPNGRLKGGGHTQAAIEEMKKRGISYNITETRPNGVRFGNVPEHKQTYKHTGNKQTWFPENWTREDVRTAGLYVANKGKAIESDSVTTKEAVWNGVNVRVLFSNDGRITTIHPSYDQ